MNVTFNDQPKGRKRGSKTHWLRVEALKCSREREVERQSRERERETNKEKWEDCLKVGAVAVMNRLPPRKREMTSNLVSWARHVLPFACFYYSHFPHFSCHTLFLSLSLCRSAPFRTLVSCFLSTFLNSSSLAPSEAGHYDSGGNIIKTFLTHSMAWVMRQSGGKEKEVAKKKKSRNKVGWKINIELGLYGRDEVQNREKVALKWNEAHRSTFAFVWSSHWISNY